MSTTVHRTSPSWSPGRLPKLRDQTVRHYRDPSSLVRREVLDSEDWGQGEFADGIARRLAAADLYWVTPQMTALAVSSAAALDEVRWSRADRPSHFGLLVWDGGLGNIVWQDTRIPVAAVSWAPWGDDVYLMYYVTRNTVLDLIADGRQRLRAIGRDVDYYPPLFPAVSHGYPTTDRWMPVEELDEEKRTVLTTTWATWALMQQEGIAERSRAEVDRKVAAAYRRADRPDPEVTLVDLRRLYHPSQPGEESDGRTFRHRWVVAGHWRNQAYGPERSLRRKQWIASYVKGPDGAPLLETTRVNVWRR